MVWLTIETPFRATRLVTVMVMGTRGGGRAPWSLTLLLVLEFSCPPHCIFPANQKGFTNSVTLLFLDHKFCC